MLKIQTNIKQVTAKLLKFPATLETIALNKFRSATDEIVRIMRQPGKPSTRPVDWDSPQQRVAFYASGGFDQGIPYRRSGGTEQAWQNAAISNGYMVSNEGHKAVFLYGTASGVGTGSKVTATGQSHIHVGRWPLFRPVVDAIIAKLPESIRQALKIEIGK
jgi:hypothetical protein